MTINVRNLEWLRSVRIDGHPEFGARLSEALSDLQKATGTIEQQTNSNASGPIAAPPVPSKLTVVPHPQGVQFSIHHDADLYADPLYEIDQTSQGVTHSIDVGTSRNGVIPNGNIRATYQVRTRYANGQSSAPVQAVKAVTGGGGSAALLPSQASSTTLPNQPPGFGGPFRGSKPPIRSNG